MGIDQKIDVFFQPIADFVASIIFYSISFGGQDIKFILIWFAVASTFFTIYLGFINVRYFKHAIDIVRGKFDRESDDGRINSFQALMTSMSGTIGLGNIAGVAVAISVGGPGAAFWMMVMAFFGMSLKFAEVTMGVKYRHHASSEHPEKLSGGPMHYLKDGFAEKGHPLLGKGLAVIYAVACIGGCIGGGLIFQVNQAYQQAYQVTGGENGFLEGNGWMFGLFVAFLTAIVIIGGIKSIANVSSRLVPVMAFIYLAAGLVVIVMHAGALPGAIVAILQSALTPEAGFGAVLASMLIGAQRAAFSNEAGLGTASIVYAATKAHHPVTQGMASMLGPFLDTIVVCMMTALVIVVTGVYQDSAGMEGVELTSRAMEQGLSWFPYVLAVSVFLFAYSTIITCSYYAVKCVTFLFGESDKIEMAFKIFFCICTAIGASVQLSHTIDFTDALFLSMAFPNIIGLYVLAPDIKRELTDYLAKLNSGKA